MTLPRRTFLKNLGFLLAAPAIVRISSLMPVKAIRPATPTEIWELLYKRMAEAEVVMRENMMKSLYGYGSATSVFQSGASGLWVHKQIAAELVFAK